MSCKSYISINSIMHVKIRLTLLFQLDSTSSPLRGYRRADDASRIAAPHPRRYHGRTRGAQPPPPREPPPPRPHRCVEWDRAGVPYPPPPPPRVPPPLPPLPSRCSEIYIFPNLPPTPLLDQRRRSRASDTSVRIHNHKRTRAHADMANEFSDADTESVHSGGHRVPSRARVSTFATPSEYRNALAAPPPLRRENTDSTLSSMQRGRAGSL